MKLKNKVICITGASSGIGKAAAIAFDAEGAQVAIAARRKDKLTETASRMHNPLIIPTDISDGKQAQAMIDATVKGFGRIDILINNAASIIVARTSEVTEEEMVRAYKTNVVGPIMAVNRALHYMRAQGGGHIINIGSPGFMIGVPLYAPYVCSKAGMSAWTRTIQAEWDGTGIIVSEYFPGYIRTDSKPDSRYPDVEQDLIIDPERNVLNTIVGRPMTPEDVARHLVKLAIKPKPLMHSGFLVKLGTFIALFPGVRKRIAADMAANVRKKLGLSIFNA